MRAPHKRFEAALETAQRSIRRHAVVRASISMMSASMFSAYVIAVSSWSATPNDRIPVRGDTFGWMATPPPIQEIEFLAQAKNYSELRERLRLLGMTGDLVLLNEYAHHIAACWFSLAKEHLAEANHATHHALTRTAFSRAYYAAYNASKAVRYLNKGIVSLKGDDHKAAPDLPSDFLSVATWSASITTLYEHRLRADYDNWLTTAATHSLTPAAAVAEAVQFVEEARKYLVSKFGMTL